MWLFRFFFWHAKVAIILGCPPMRITVTTRMTTYIFRNRNPEVNLCFSTCEKTMSGWWMIESTNVWLVILMLVLWLSYRIFCSLKRILLGDLVLLKRFYWKDVKRGPPNCGNKKRRFAPPFWKAYKRQCCLRQKDLGKGTIKPCKEWERLPINWCRIS